MVQLTFYLLVINDELHSNLMSIGGWNLWITRHPFGEDEIQMFTWDIFSFLSNRKWQHRNKIKTSTKKVTSHYNITNTRSCSMDFIVEIVCMHPILGGGTSMWCKIDASIKLANSHLQSWSSHGSLCQTNFPSCLDGAYLAHVEAFDIDYHLQWISCSQKTLKVGMNVLVNKNPFPHDSISLIVKFVPIVTNHIVGKDGC
jgi:hypothetical protein